MKRKLGVLILVFCMLFSMSVSVQAASLTTEERRPAIEIVLYDEYGEILSVGKENGKIVSQLANEIIGKKVNDTVISSRACTHIPCNQYEGYLYAHAKINSSECWVYRMRAIICKCCGEAVKQLSGWEFQYSHPAHW